MSAEPSDFDRAYALLGPWLRKHGGGVTMNDAAERLGLSRIRIAQLTKKELLVTTKLENLVIISRRSLEEYAAVMATRPTRKKPPWRPQLVRPEHAKWAERFLDALRRGKAVNEAARAAGVTRQTVYTLRARDERFAAAWDAALPGGPKVAGRPGRPPARRAPGH